MKSLQKLIVAGVASSAAFAAGVISAELADRADIVITAPLALYGLSLATTLLITLCALALYTAMRSPR
jgi:hypothetical protein